MGYNRKVLSKAVSELDKAKAPAKPKDIITDPRGQWKYPGMNTRIPGSDITMQGVSYPVWAQPNVGAPQMMYPGQDYQFPGADYVDEYPMEQAKRGGEKKYSRSLSATNVLFKKNALINKKKSKKKKIFDPNAKYYQEGGAPYNYNPFVSNGPEEEEEAVQAFDAIRSTNDPEDYEQFLNYSQTAPENRRPTENYVYGSSDEYDHYGMWDALGKPKDFQQALEMNPDWQPDPYDKMYHGFSLNPNTGVFLKSGKPGLKEGDTTWMEIAGHYQGRDAQKYTPVFDPELNRFKYILNEQAGGDISIPELTRAQDGYANKPAGKFEGEDYYNALTMANRDLQEVKVKPKADQLHGTHWLRFQREFQNATPYDAFARERREKYLKRTNKGLNELAGVTEENFPEAAENRIKKAYERKMNTYMAKRLADEVGFDPKKRGQWVDELYSGAAEGDPLAQKYLEIFTKSDYQGKLNKPIGARLKSGLQQTANIFLPKDYEFNYDIEGYTPEENKAAKTDWTEPLEIFSFGEAPAQVLANMAYTNPSIAGTEGGYRPDIFSGEIRPDAQRAVQLFDPTNYMGLHSGTKFLGTGLRHAGKAAKTTGEYLAKKTKPYGKVIARQLDTPLLESLSTSSVKPIRSTANYLGLTPEVVRNLQNSNNPAYNFASRFTPAEALKTQTIIAAMAGTPELGTQGYDYLTNKLWNPNITNEQRVAEGKDLLKRSITTGISLSPLTKWTAPIYSKPASYGISLLDNLQKVYQNDPGAARAIFNASRLLAPARQKGGVSNSSYETELSSKEIKDLQRQGYKIEFLD